MGKCSYDKAEAQRRLGLKKQLIEKMLSVKGKLEYTQGERRDDIEDGYADCSSLVRWAYKIVTGIDIGEDTAVQIINPHGIDVDTAAQIINAGGIDVDTAAQLINIDGIDADTMPDMAHLEIGDLLFFTGKDARRPFCVGHVEMYMGGGKLIGQNDRPYKGPTVKDMAAYIGEIGRRGHRYIKTRRFIY